MSRFRTSPVSSCAKGRPRTALIRANSVTHLSPIFDWYREDFGKTDQAILGFVAPYFDGGAEPPAFNGSGLKIRVTPYEGSLSIQKPRRTQ